MSSESKLIHFKPKIEEFTSYFQLQISHKEKELQRQIDRQFYKQNDKQLTRELNLRNYLSRETSTCIKDLEQIRQLCLALYEKIKGMNLD